MFQIYECTPCVWQKRWNWCRRDLELRSENLNARATNKLGVGKEYGLGMKGKLRWRFFFYLRSGSSVRWNLFDKMMKFTIFWVQVSFSKIKCKEFIFCCTCFSFLSSGDFSITQKSIKIRPINTRHWASWISMNAVISYPS
jgi:hypothetical protein